MRSVFRRFTRCTRSVRSGSTGRLAAELAATANVAGSARHGWGRLTRQSDLEGRARLGPMAMGGDGTLMELDQMAGYRQAEPEPAMTTRLAGIGLTIALEDVRQ